jgi:hypothetical protein
MMAVVKGQFALCISLMFKVTAKQRVIFLEENLTNVARKQGALAILYV